MRKSAGMQTRGHKKGVSYNMLSKSDLLKVLEGNRRLTVRTIESFPEKELFHFSAAEGMRPFSEMIIEILGIEQAYVRGIALNKWEWEPGGIKSSAKEELLTACQDIRSETLKLWEEITEERLSAVEKDPFFEAPPTSHLNRILYSLENEIHHRGQGFVYLRCLGIEPPAFYER